MALLPGLPQGQPQAPQQGAEQPDQSKYVDDAEGNASPEEQAQYEKAVDNALELIYPQGQQGKVEPAVIEQLKAAEGGGDGGEGAPNPAIMALAQAAVTIVSKLDDSSREAGMTLTDDVLGQTGLTVIELLAEVADAAGIYDYSEEDMTGAYAQAIDMYREKAIADGRTDEDTLKAQFEEINQADAAGQLDTMLPGLGGQAPVEQQEA